MKKRMNSISKAVIASAIVFALIAACIKPVDEPETASAAFTTYLETYSDGYYKITNWADLKEMKEIIDGTNGTFGYTANFRLSADITPDQDPSTGETEPWTAPIETYSGFLDGNGHTLNGLEIIINDDTMDYAGFFKRINSATITNLHFKNCKTKTVPNSFTADKSFQGVGILAGNTYNCTLQNLLFENCSIDFSEPQNTSYTYEYKSVYIIAGNVDTETISNSGVGVSVMGGSISSSNPPYYTVTAGSIDPDTTLPGRNKLTKNSSDVYLISSAEDFLEMKRMIEWNKGPDEDADKAKYLLTNDISGIGTIKPIGTQLYGTTTEFSGEFDGGNHSITGLVVDFADTAPQNSSVGIFKQCKDATIQNLTLDACSIQHYVGGVSNMQDNVHYKDFGLVAGTATNTTMKNININSAQILLYPRSNGNSAENINVIAGTVDSNTIKKSSDVTLDSNWDIKCMDDTGDFTPADAGETDTKILNGNLIGPTPTTAPTRKPPTPIPNTDTDTTPRPAIASPPPIATTAPTVAPPQASGLQTPGGGISSAAPPTTPTPVPTKTPEPGIPKKGDVIETDDLSYVVTKTGEVAVTGTVDENGSSVTIPDVVEEGDASLKVTRILTRAFEGEDIKTVSVGKNIEVIESKAFLDCTKLNKLTFKTKCLKFIGARAFENCRKLTSVKLPGSLLELDRYAFKDCPSLTKFSIGAESISKSASRPQDLLSEYAEKRFEEPEVQEWIKAAAINITIDVGVFQNCKNLKRVVINCQVTIIGNSAFSKCKSLAAIVVYSKKLKTVGDKALTGVHNCKISVYKVKLKVYKKLFKNKGQGKKVVVAKL